MQKPKHDDLMSLESAMKAFDLNFAPRLGTVTPKQREQIKYSAQRMGRTGQGYGPAVNGRVKSNAGDPNAWEGVSYEDLYSAIASVLPERASIDPYPMGPNAKGHSGAGYIGLKMAGQGGHSSGRELLPADRERIRKEAEHKKKVDDFYRIFSGVDPDTIRKLFGG